MADVATGANPGVDVDTDTSGQETQAPEWLGDYGLDDGAQQALSKYETVEAALTGAVEAQKMLGKSIRIPGDDATDEDRAKFQERLAKAVGRPETADGYEIVRPEMPEGMGYNEDAEKALRDIAFRHVIPQAAVTELYDLYNKTVLGAHQTSEADAMKRTEQAEAQLKKDWGKDFKANMELNVRLLQQYAGSKKDQEALKAYFEETGAGDNVPLVKFVNSLAQALIAEGVTIHQGSPPTGGGVQTFSEQFYAKKDSVAGA
jgi:hypothetical protein